MKFFTKSGDSKSVGDDRLRRAIERNRAKVAKKNQRERSYSSNNRHKPSAKKFTFLSGPNDMSIRKSVGRPENIQFTNQRVNKPDGISSFVNRTSFLSQNSKWAEALKKWAGRAGWVFCLFLIFRLAFGDRGVMNYYGRKGTYRNYVHHFENLQKENLSIRDEIKIIKTDRRYQKKLIRDFLGYISKDEYLILFAKKKDTPSI